MTLKGCKLCFESLDGHTIHRSILELFQRKTTRSSENSEEECVNGHEIDEDEDKGGADNLYANSINGQLKENSDSDFAAVKRCRASNCRIKSWLQMDPRLFCFVYDEQQNKCFCKLIETHGVSLGRRHRSKNYSWQFVAALNEPVEAENLRALKQARVHSLVVDESTEFATEKHLLMYTKFLAKTELQVKFIKLLYLDGKADAMSLYKSIKKFYVEHQICFQSMAMITTNGSAIMMGSKGGLHVKLKVDIPWLLGQHFVVHSEALAIKEAYNDISLFEEIDGCFKAIYSYFSRSTVKHSGLEEVFNVLELSTIKLAKARNLKWINRGRAVQAICKSYQTLIIYFSDMSNVDHDITAESILLKLQQPRILLAIFFLRDLLHHLDNLSLFFHEKFVNPVRVPERVQATINLLECKYLGNNILWESSFLLGIQMLESGALSRPPTSRKPHGPILHKTAAKATDEIAAPVKALVRIIVDSLKERFPDNVIIRAFRILDPDRIPSDPEKLAQYGNNEAAALQNHFSDLLSNNGKDLVAEWDQMKYLIATRKGESLDEVCIDLAHSDMWRKEYPNFSILSEVCVVMSASTIEPERGFSSVNLIKNKYRNRLTSDQLDQLLRLCLEKPEEAQDYLDAAYAAWLQAEQWRLLLKEWRRGEESKTESDSTESDLDPLSDSE
uniref:Uncharacterized LOC103176722 n=1 Tax=Callorhinchus milii TaxID=7868 RepID=A0A4W3K064_CALMI